MAIIFSRICALLSIFALLLLTGCSEEQVDQAIRGNMNTEAVETAEEVALLVTSHDQNGLIELAHSEARSAFEAEAAMTEFFSIVPNETPDSITFAQFNTNHSSFNGQPVVVDHNIVLVMEFPDQRAQLSLWLRNEDDHPRLLHVNIAPIEDKAIESASDFSAADWIALCLVPVTAVFVLITLITAILTRRLKRRILWSVFIVLVGYPVFGYLTTSQSWSLLAPAVTPTGNSVNFQLIKLTLFSASWETSTFTGHHAVNIAVPFGAMLFWLQRVRGKLARKPDPRQLDTTEAEAGTATDVAAKTEISDPDAP